MEKLLKAYISAKLFFDRNREKIVKYSRILGLVMVFVAIALMFTEVSYAQEDSALYVTIRNLVKGGIGKSIAIIGFLVGGIAMFMGNFTLGLMMLIGAGFIALAPTLIDAIFKK